MRKTVPNVGAIVLFSAFLLAVPAPDAGAGQGRGHGQAKKADKAEQKADKKNDKRDDKQNDDRVLVVDRDGHIRAIREYGRGGSLPPGLAKRESLPPGLRKQL